MATGFTIDTPLKVARFGIDSVVSLVDDVLLEQMRRKISEQRGLSFEPIRSSADDSRASRVTAYLDLLQDLVTKQMHDLRAAVFTVGSDLRRHFEMLPDSPLRSLFERMLATKEEAQRLDLQDRLRASLHQGSIDVNIMTKLDRDIDRKGRIFSEGSSDALSALRGWIRSTAEGAVVLSAGMNRRLFRAMSRYAELQPDSHGCLRKRIILKVSDFRSASVQGKQLAKLGLHVSEFRVESGLNCGGHAFGGKGQLLGPVLEEFRRGKAALLQTLHALRLRALGQTAATAMQTEPLPTRITAQGGLGEAHEQDFLRQEYGVDGTGWGSAFLLVPEVVNIDGDSLNGIREAEEGDIQLSDSSPLGIPFWSLRTSASEAMRLKRIEVGKAGSPCPKGFLAMDTEFSEVPLCTGSRSYQEKKLAQIEASPMTAMERQQATLALQAKACICHDLAGGATGPLGLDARATTSVCCGPNTAYFTEDVSLAQMVDHIYGRDEIPLKPGRPHMFLKELQLNLDYLKKEWNAGLVSKSPSVTDFDKASHALEEGIAHYRSRIARLPFAQRSSLQIGLETLAEELENFRMEMRVVPSAVRQSLPNRR